MPRPLLLDLFCGAGGAAVGYHRAGFDVIGVDILARKRYPFRFEQADALDYLSEEIALATMSIRKVDAVHASPPCQAHTRAGHLRAAQGKPSLKPDLIAPVRALLRELGVPYVIENVPGAPLINPVTLCGSMFGLRVRRHREFESNVELTAPRCDHKAQGRPVGVYHRLRMQIPHGGRTAGSIEEAREAMGIDWMIFTELKEAIPPSYTELIGKQLLAHIEQRRAVA